MKKEIPNNNPKKGKSKNPIWDQVKHPPFTSENQPLGAGRPKGSMSVKAYIKRVIEGNAKVKINGVNVELPKLEGMILAIVNRILLKGDAFAFDKLMERFEGKVPQPMKISGDPVDPLIIQERKQIEHLSKEQLEVLLKTLYPETDGQNKA